MSMRNPYPPHPQAYMNNVDPSNEFMFQLMPDMMDPRGFGLVGVGVGVVGGGRGDEGTEASQPIDLKALNARLQTLGLNASSTSLLPSHTHTHSTTGHPALGSAFRSKPTSPNAPQPPSKTTSRTRQPAPAPGPEPIDPFSPRTDASVPRQPPTAIELGPSDSLSQMYRPFRGPPPESLRASSRAPMPRPGTGMGMGPRQRHGHGGTNVDPGEGQAEGAGYEDDYDEGRSAWETRGPPISDAGDMEAMTLGRTEWAETANPDMATMRSRLLAAQEADQSAHLDTLNMHMLDATQLASALAKLEATEDQLRTLQATLIAERVARSQIERDVHEGEGDLRDIKNELGSAVRALRRAKEEGKRNEEERRRLARCFEETKVQYHEELKVRDARAKGREEGRVEAWQEAERWMGGDPPIPVDPVNQVPQAVLRHTPMPNQANLPITSPQPAFMGTASLQQPPPQPPSQQGLYSAQPQGYQPDQAQNHSFGQAVQLYQPAPAAHHQQPQPQQPLPPLPASQQQQQQPPPQTMPFDNDPPSRVMPGMGRSTFSPPQQMSNPPQSMAHGQPHGQSNMGHQGPMQPQQHTGMNGSHYPGGPSGGMMPQFTGQGGGMMPQHTGQGGHGLPAVMPIPVPIPVGGHGAAQPVPVVLQPVGVPVAMYQAPDLLIHSQGPHTHPLPAHSQAPTYNTPGRSTQRLDGTDAGRTAHGNGGGHRRTQTLGSTSLRVPAPESVPHGHAADSYLDRVEHDPKLRSILAGQPSRTVGTHPSAFQSEQPMTAQSFDKPLPPPGGAAGTNLARSQTTYAGHGQGHGGGGGHGTSTRAPTAAGTAGGRNRRNSLMSGLHAHSHAQSYLNEGDRYPAFPHQHPQGVNNGHGMGHARHSSCGSIDPAGVALPKSMAGSVFQTPGSRHAPMSAKATPQTGRSRRSKFADALRGGTDFDGELSDIQEEERRHAQAQAQAQAQHQMQGGAGQQTHVTPPNTHMGTVPPPQPRQPSYAPSMPPMRPRPAPRMPAPLGGGGGGGKAGSEPHGLHGGHGQQDPSMQYNSRLPDPPISDKPMRSHDLYVPPGMAPLAVHGSVEDIQGPRTSALGLEGMEDQAQHRGARSRAGTVGGHSMAGREGGGSGGGGFFGKAAGGGKASKAPTSSRSRSGPNTQLNTPLSPSQTHADVRSAKDAAHAHAHGHGRNDSLLPSAAAGLPASTQHNSGRGDGAGAGRDEALYVPLPSSRPHAPTAYSRSAWSADTDERNAADVEDDDDAQDVYIHVHVPKNAHAHGHGLGHGARPARSAHSAKSASRANANAKPTPEVNVIDFAMQRALPDSRPTTAYSMGAPSRRGKEAEKASVATISDPDAPGAHAPVPNKEAAARAPLTERSAVNGRAGGNGPGEATHRGVGGMGTGMGMDPRSVPLPVSRAGTYRRGPSTYAGTVAPIEEVTEDESYKGMRARRGRA